MHRDPPALAFHVLCLPGSDSGNSGVLGHHGTYEKQFFPEGLRGRVRAPSATFSTCYPSESGRMMDIPPQHSLPEGAVFRRHQVLSFPLPFEPHTLLPFPEGEGIRSDRGKLRVGLVLYSRSLEDQVQITCLQVRNSNTLPVQTDPTRLPGQQDAA